MMQNASLGDSCYHLSMTGPETFFHAHGASPDALPELCRRFHVRRLDLFGSAATGHNFDPVRSDLDLLVSFEPLPPSEYANAYFGLREALEALSGRPIDLLTEAALRNPYLRRRVESERRPLFPSP